MTTKTRITLLTLGTCVALAATASDRISVQQLGWLAGCWAYDGADAGSVEQWMTPAGSSMLGMSRMVSDGRSVAFEYMQIAETSAGSLAFTALPSGQASATFELFRIGDSEVAFENQTHDFPQRIIYQRDGDTLLGRVEGNTPDGEHQIDFPMTRTACTAQ